MSLLVRYFYERDRFDTGSGNQLENVIMSSTKPQDISITLFINCQLVLVEGWNGVEQLGAAIHLKEEICRTKKVN